MATGPRARATALHALRDSAAGCRECPLGSRATQTVWGEGPVDALLMIVGEVPGDREFNAGAPNGRSLATVRNERPLK